jgi:hypothetical protein
MIPLRRSDLTGGGGNSGQQGRISGPSPEFLALGAEIPAWSENYAKEAKKTLEKVDRHQSKFNARFPRRDTASRNKLFATNKWIGPN